MPATRQAAWGSLAAPMRDGAGNSVLQSNQFLPGQRKAYLSGFEIPDSFSQSPSSTLLTGNSCNRFAWYFKQQGFFPTLPRDQGRGGSSRDESLLHSTGATKNHSLFRLPPPRSGIGTHPTRGWAS